MRTKDSNDARRVRHDNAAHTNGTPRKSPSQPHELSDAEREQLRVYLSNNANPFEITTYAPSKKRKRSSTPMLSENDIFEPRLSVNYEIKPANHWESLRRYKKFTVGSESIAVGECILVKHDDSEPAKLDVGAQWKAKVLEVRALDSEHVYIRVAWLNRPEDLRGGRKAYHGKNELVPTNQMDIIDAMTVNGRLEIYHWNEEDDDSPMPGKDEYFWRQTYDFVSTKTFSKLRLICVDEAPQNPDEIILQCPDPDCRKWLHVKCIAEDAVARANNDLPARGKRKSTGPTPKKRSTLTDPSISPNSAAQAIALNGLVTAEVFIRGLPDGPDEHPAENTEIVLTSEDGEKRSESICCLFCHTAIE